MWNLAKTGVLPQFSKMLLWQPLINVEKLRAFIGLCLNMGAVTVVLDCAENNASKFTTTSQCHVYTKNIKFNKGIIDISQKNVTYLYSFLCKVIFSELCNINQLNATS